MVSAVARKLEFFVQDHKGIDIKMTKLALNEEQINKFSLPKAPKHGEAVVELDALEAIHPGELSKIVESALSPYYDEEKVRKVEEENRKIRAKAKKMLDEVLKPRLTEAFSTLDVGGITKGVDLTETRDETFKVPEPGHEVKEISGWMYDSTIGYWKQLKEYKKYKASREEEAV